MVKISRNKTKKIFQKVRKMWKTFAGGKNGNRKPERNKKQNKKSYDRKYISQYKQKTGNLSGKCL